MAVSFEPVRAEAPYTLYARTGDGAGGPRAYILLYGTPPSGPLDVGSAWSYPVAYVAAAAEITADLATLAGWVLLVQPGEATRSLAWVGAGPGAVAAVALARTDATTGQVAAPSGSVTVPFGNLAFVLPSGAVVTVGADGLAIAPTESSGDVQLSRGGTVLSPDGAVTCGLGAGATGALAFTATWDAWDLFTLARDDQAAADAPGGGELRYFAAAGGGGYHQVVHPLLPPASDDLSFALAVRLDPLAPYDGTRTSLLLTSVPRGYARASALTVSGAPVTVTPRAGAGFWLARRPDTGGETGCVYLAPLGPFDLTPPGGAAALMCGLSALEHLEVATGDVLELVPNGAALAGTASGAPPLSPAYTTSWAALRPAAPRTYVGQPGASVSYSPAARAGMTLPAAVGSNLATVPPGGTAPFPWVPYGSPTATSAGAPGGLAATVESTALAGVRSDVLRAPPPSLAAGAEAVGDLRAPVFTDASGTALAGGRGATPNGQVVVLNTDPAGTWQRVLLASTPAGDASFEADPATGVVDPAMSSALLRDQLFLVISDWDHVPPGTVKAGLSVDGWNLDIARVAGAPPPVLVLKFATSASLRDLVTTPGAWASSDVFVGDAAAVAATVKTLEAALAAADPPVSGPDPFVAFRALAADPSWTGLICFGAPVDGKDMPAGLTMLLAGIHGPLTAHHVGLAANRVVTDASGQPSIGESSVFGVIHYAAPPAPPPDPAPYRYRVLRLDVVFANSTATGFHATAGIRFGELFGRAVTYAAAAPGEPDEVTLAGTYQEHGGVGTVTFTLPEPAVFSFAARPAVRVLDTFTLTDASLAPAAPAGGTETGGARVTYAGSLAFAAAPFPTARHLDLFSYDALRLAGLGLDIVYATGAITADYAAVTVAGTGAGPRPGSVASRLPLTPTAFLADPAGLTATKLGGKAVNVVELAGAPGTHGSRRAYTTASVQYAVSYRLPLGSLGALSDVRASLDAGLVVGWGPSTYTPDEDGAALYITLPGVSAGAFSFNLQGLLTTTFGDATLSRVVLPKGATWVLLFNNVALSLLGYRFPPQVVADLVLFAGTDPHDPQPLGWSLAAVQVQGGAA